MRDAVEVLAQLRASPVFEATLPRRVRIEHATWATLTEELRREAVNLGVAASTATPDQRAIVDLVRELGQARHEPAVPTLTTLWKECAVKSVHVACGHALRKIGSKAARAALEESLEDADRFSVFIAVRAVFDADPAAAYERFAPYCDDDLVRRPGGDVIPRVVLDTFAPGAFTNRGPQWIEPRAPAWLRDDERWIRLCVRLRLHASLGRAARNVLRYADADAVDRALRLAAPTEAPRATRSRSERDGSLLDRYRAGEHAAVWTELGCYDTLAGAFREEALDVARETMRRVLHNTEILSARLAAEGWTSLSGSLRTPSSREDVDAMQQIEQLTDAPLPLSLRAFWEIVGGVDLMWDYERDDDAPDLGLGLDLPGLDPLVIEPARCSTRLFDEWADARAGVRSEIADPYALELAPDFLHKNNISGGAPYGVALPFPGADPVFENEAHGLSFVEYLRLCFRWGGFPRLERHGDTVNARRFVRRMIEGFQPF